MCQFTPSFLQCTFVTWILISTILLLLSSSSSSPLCRVFILIFLRQTMSLGNTVLQLFSLFLFMVLISLVSVLNLLYFYVSTFRSMCAVSNMAVFCSSLTSWFPGIYYYYYYYYYYSAEFVAVAVIDSFIDCFPQTPMARVMLMPFSVLICALCMSKEISFTKFLWLMFSRALNLAHLARTLLVFELPLWTSSFSTPIHVSVSFKNWPTVRCATVRCATTKNAVLLRTGHDGPKWE